MVQTRMIIATGRSERLRFDVAVKITAEDAEVRERQKASINPIVSAKLCVLRGESFLLPPLASRLRSFVV